MEKPEIHRRKSCTHQNLNLTSLTPTNCGNFKAELLCNENSYLAVQYQCIMIRWVRTDTLWQDRAEKSSWIVSLLLKQTQECVLCLKIRNFVLKMDLIVYIDPRSHKLKKKMKIASKTPLFWGLDFPIFL